MLSPTVSVRLCILSLLWTAGGALQAATENGSGATLSSQRFVHKSTSEIVELTVTVSSSFGGWRRSIYDDNATPFPEIIVSHLKGAGYDDEVKEGGAARPTQLTLQVELSKIKSPSFGRSVTATAYCAVKLVRVDGAQVLLDQTFEGTEKEPMKFDSANLRTARAYDKAMNNLAAQVVKEVQRALVEEALK